MTTAAVCSPVPARHRVTALLGLLVESFLSGQEPPVPPGELVEDPWDLWWACYRAACPPPADLGQAMERPRACPRCARQVRMLLEESVPGHPQDLPGGPCGCLRAWAIEMRRPAPEADWPAHRVSVALTKPGSPAARTVELLSAAGCAVVENRIVHLRWSDVRRLYPEAYGAQFVRAQDAYLTSAPGRVVVLLLPDHWATNPAGLKRAVRAALGGADVLRNHLHMPDNPADALCDLTHLAGPTLTEHLYDRHERPWIRERLDGYRRVVEQPRRGTRAG